MRKVLDDLMKELAKNGCEIISADFTRVIFSFEKAVRADALATEWQEIWGRTRSNLQETEVFKRCLRFDDDHIERRFFGLLWMDQANNCGIPFNWDEEVKWEPMYDLQRAEVLPPGVKTQFYVYVAHWVIGPMRQMEKLKGTEAERNAEYREWLHNSFVPEYRRKLYHILTKLGDHRELELATAAEKSAEEAETIHERWKVPRVPGMIEQPESDALLSFVKLLDKVLQLEKDTKVKHEVRSIRRDLLSLLCRKEFDPDTEYREALCPVKINVHCESCKMVEVIDVTTHETKAPGEFVCRCGALYGRKHVEGLLLVACDALLASWQAQDLHCVKCRGTQHDLVKKLCNCAGKYQGMISEENVRNSLFSMQSVAEPHGFVDLGEVLQDYLALL
jgi:hypothetical protein